MKLLMVTTHYPPLHIGGDAVFVQYLSRELAKSGHEVHVLTSPSVYQMLKGTRNHDREASCFEPILHTYKPHFARLDSGVTLAFGFSAGAERTLKRILTEVKPQIIHWHNAKAFFSRIPEVSNAKSLYTAHDYYSVCPRSNLTRIEGIVCDNPRLCQLCLLRWRKVPQLWRIGRRRTAVLPTDVQILCPSEFMATRLRDQGLTVSGVLPNFVPEPAIRGTMQRSSERKISYVGVLERHKGVATLLEAFSLSRERQGFKLILIGNGSLKEEVTNRAEALGLQDRIDIMGFLPRQDVEKTVSESDAAVVPSEWPENAPLVAMESLSLGTPIIGSDAGGIYEIVGRDSDSMLFKAGNPSDLARALCIAWNRGNRGIGISSRRAYDDNFSPKAHLAKYLSIIGI